MKLTLRLLSAGRYLTTLLFLFACLQFIACSKGSNDLSPTDKVKALLTAKPWKVSSVTANGIDETSQFANFSITFSENNYSTVNGGPVWPSSDTWSFKGSNDPHSIIRGGDGIEIQLMEVSSTDLKMSFTWNKTTLGPGRITSTSGEIVFALAN